MTDLRKRNVLGVLIDAIDDYEPVVSSVVTAARDGRGLAVSALAVHGIMCAVREDAVRYRVNRLDVVTPDGQPVRWGLNLLYDAGLRDRVYGPTLMLRLCAAAASEGLPVYLYGSTGPVVTRLRTRLECRFPRLKVAGAEPSRFRRTGHKEQAEIGARIRESGARITLVGLGCPRQESFAYGYRDELAMPVVAVGAAFDYHAGNLREPPRIIQRVGLQWLHRLVQEPRRLWKRYLLLNPAYLGLLALQGLRLWRPDPDGVEPPAEELVWG